MRLGVKYKGDLKVTTDDTPTEKPKLKDLWSGKYLARTIMLWIVWFGIVYSYYGILHGCLLSFISKVLPL